MVWTFHVPIVRSIFLVCLGRCLCLNRLFIAFRSFPKVS
jgi:hypothetical protein